MQSNYRVVDKTVRVYWNSHRHLYSVQHKVDKQWRILHYSTHVILADVRFIVNPTGSQKVKDTKAKNVHAYVEGKWTIIDPSMHQTTPALRYYFATYCGELCKCPQKDCVGKVVYDPIHHSSFMDVQTVTPITEAPFCSLETWFHAPGPIGGDWSSINHPERYNFRLTKQHKADVYATEHL